MVIVTPDNVRSGCVHRPVPTVPPLHLTGLLGLRVCSGAKATLPNGLKSVNGAEQ